MCFVRAMRVASRLVMACCGTADSFLAWSTTTVKARCSIKAGVVALGQVLSGLAGLVMACQVTETTYTVGVVAASMPQGGMNQGKLGHGWLRPVVSMLFWSRNHHRLGTEADRRGRGGMCFGESGSCRLRFV